MYRRTVLVALLALACGGARTSDTGAAAAPAPAGPAVAAPALSTPASATSPSAANSAGSFAGEYTTDVTLVRSSCRGIEVESRPTSVTQGSNAQSLTITHGMLRFDARLRDTSFTARPVSTEVGPQTHTLTLSGTFSERTMNAEVRVKVEEVGVRPCDYLVKWVGTRQ
jgi:hypothetical protein